ncbi:hypothetical protein TCE0_034r12010 [Talaromyces pinophilus]|uniref:Hemerythrin-like domain-containing protein n=1 Tax=Talaromyces pinophilus TaxID=128442 RepID=A0A6V8HES3_TALPI|nr:hypothetical protein DPV78_003225 [Talaromyces pinophilus]GAM40002.1 hypothetical protein TCE0_034r12010 [Talaromyces pinophilus]
MSDQCDIKKSEDTSLAQSDGVDCGEPKEKLPKLTPAEFRVYNRLAEHMDYFHNHFRHSWNELYTACCENKRPSGVSIRQFLNMGTQFLSQLNIHHSIEEQSIFPILARKMPEFKREVHLLKQHKEIHKGMDRLEAYLMDCRSGEKELRLDEMKKVMDSFGKVLWDHLEDEVRTLGAENMRKYWTQEEMRRLPM